MELSLSLSHSSPFFIFLTWKWPIASLEGGFFGNSVSKGFPWVPQVFLSLAAGCLGVGRRPKSPGSPLRLDRKRKPRMKSLWLPGYTGTTTECVRNRCLFDSVFVEIVVPGNIETLPGKQRFILGQKV